jgi:hypothetical protein
MPPFEQRWSRHGKAGLEFSAFLPYHFPVFATQPQSEQIEQEENIPDLIPEEIGSSKELKQAYQSLRSRDRSYSDFQMNRPQ